MFFNKKFFGILHKATFTITFPISDFIFSSYSYEIIRLTLNTLNGIANCEWSSGFESVSIVK
jgi:hypothetical protein